MFNTFSSLLPAGGAVAAAAGAAGAVAAAGGGAFPQEARARTERTRRKDLAFMVGSNSKKKCDVDCAASLQKQSIFYANFKKCGRQ
jgi:hypothetical protein